MNHEPPPVQTQKDLYTERTVVFQLLCGIRASLDSMERPGRRFQRYRRLPRLLVAASCLFGLSEAADGESAPLQPRSAGRWGSPGGGAGPREVDARYLRGTWKVDQGHQPGRQVVVCRAGLARKAAGLCN